MRASFRGLVIVGEGTGERGGYLRSGSLTGGESPAIFSGRDDDASDGHPCTTD
jgi:hypothetical protein